MARALNDRTLQFGEFPQPDPGATRGVGEMGGDGTAAEERKGFHGSPEPLPARRAVARILRPARSAMTTGRARTQGWILELEPGSRVGVDPLMGWETSDDPLRQVCLRFRTREEAVAFAEKEGWPYEVAEPKEDRALKPRSYADNFRWPEEPPATPRVTLPGGMPSAKG